MPYNELLTVQQVIEKLKISDETVYRHIRSGRLRAIRIGDLWRIPTEALDEFIRRGEQKAQ